MTDLRFKFKPGQQARLAPVRERAVILPDATRPFMEAPPMITTTVDEVADVLGIDAAAPAPITKNTTDEFKYVPQAASHSVRRAARDFMRWRAEQR